MASLTRSVSFVMQQPWAVGNSLLLRKNEIRERFMHVLKFILDNCLWCLDSTWCQTSKISEIETIWHHQLLTFHMYYALGCKNARVMNWNKLLQIENRIFPILRSNTAIQFGFKSTKIPYCKVILTKNVLVNEKTHSQWMLWCLWSKSKQRFFYVSGKMTDLSIPEIDANRFLSFIFQLFYVKTIFVLKNKVHIK